MLNIEKSLLGKKPIWHLQPSEWRIIQVSFELACTVVSQKYHTYTFYQALSMEIQPS